MSLQLIVYPQSDDGTLNQMSSTSTEVLVYGSDFTNLSYFYTATTLYPYTEALTNAPPSIVNLWYAFRTSVSGTPSYPSESSGNLVLSSVPTTTASGVYQQLSNLAVGQQYTLTIDISNTGTGLLNVRTAQSNNITSVQAFSAASSQITRTFTASSQNDIVMITYTNNQTDTISISNMSIQPVIGAVPSGAIQLLGDGQVILDIYEDEDLPLTLSVDNFKNVAEKVQSYSKAFNLPGTKRNNKIFDQVFEVTRDLTIPSLLFNPYKKTRTVLKQDGFILFEGYLRLLDITDKNGEISYNVNLYSEVIALADYLKELSFQNLDFKELQHEYNKTQIKASWNDGVTSGQTTPITWINANASGFRTDFSTVKYPFVNWNNQMLIANGSTGSNATLNNPELTALEQAFRPFISVKYIIEKIFENSPFTFTSNFFDTPDFKKLYMDFNWGSGNAPVLFTNTATSGFPNFISYTPGANTVDFPFATIPSDFGYSAGVFTAQADNQIYNITYNIEMMSAAGGPYTLTCEWVDSTGTIYNTQTLTPNLVGSSYFTFYSGSFSSIPLSLGDTLFCRFTVVSGVITIRDNQTNSFIGTTSAYNTTNETLLETLRGELGQWDFLKGLITMFNLVTLPDQDDPNNIKIEPYSDIFITPTLTTPPLNWTDKIDVSEMKLEPLTDLKRKTIFKFVEDDDDFAFMNYKKQVGGHLYGSKKFIATDEFNILLGLDEVIAEPFAATVVKPFASQYPAFITPAIYAYNSEDDTSEGFDNSPRIMFDNGQKPTGASYYIPAQNGVGDSNEPNYLQFSHIKDPGLSITGGSDFNFGECQLLGNIASPINNLFYIYWLPYYNELYNVNTRTMTIKVNLSPADINTFRFNDTVMIKNRVFRVNRIDYKPNDLATVEFILIP